MPAADLSSTPERCDAEPLPAEAKESSPGRALASAMSSATDFAGTAALTRRTLGSVCSDDTGARSFTGSKARLL